uniref:Uncharacterized protein LOC114339941 n=1 Tax=Diabrotica virgifera virgifera TaxID=50390 RepID=A0A6P7GAT7_DIAVI
MTFQNMSIPPPTRFELLPSCSTRPPPNYNIFGESPSHHTQTYSKVHHKQSTGTFHKPVKRLRPNSPDPIEIAHRDIVSQPRTLGPDSSILTNNSYVKNLNTSDFSTHHSGLGSENVKIILELVANIISTIRRTNNYDISKTELEFIISKQLNIDSSENTLNSQIQYKK